MNEALPDKPKQEAAGFGMVHVAEPLQQFFRRGATTTVADTVAEVMGPDPVGGP